MLVRNLLQNALRPTANRVTLRQDGPVLEISDIGGGLPDDARRILTGREGELRPLESGLGLYIVQPLVARLDCRLEVLTSPLGRTHIRIELRRPGEIRIKRRALAGRVGFSFVSPSHV